MLVWDFRNFMPSPPPPLPPRTCQSLLGPILPPKHAPHSPACSDLSSINGDVFFPETDLSLSVPLRPPGTPRYHPQCLVSGTMQEAETDLVVKQKMLYFKMRNFDPVDIDESTLAIVDDKMKTFDDALSKFMEGIEILLISHIDTLGAERVNQWKTVQTATEKDSIEYRKKVYQKVNTVKKDLVPTLSRSAPMHAQSQITSSIFQNEQLKEMRKQNEILERTQQEKENERQEKFNETVKENESKKAAANAKAKNKLDAIHADCDDLADKLGSISLEEWKLQSDLSICRAMKEIKSWEDSLEKIVALKRNLDDVIASNDLDQNQVDYLEVKIAVERAVQDVEEGVRTHKIDIEAKLNEKVPITHPIVTWLVENVAYILNKFKVGHDGKRHTSA